MDWKTGRLIVFSGLPGTGKSSVARRLAEAVGGLWLRIDTVEQAIRDASVLRDGVDDAGYRVTQGIARDNLGFGQTVIADCVNDWRAARNAWRDSGLRAQARVFEIEIVCRDAVEHRRRVETREIDVAGLSRPIWEEIIAREYHLWDRERLVIDTSRLDVEASVAAIQRYIAA